MGEPDRAAVRKRGVTISRALNAIPADVGRGFTMRTEEGGFRIQKAVYLLRHMRYAPAGHFDYNLYQMGPYSPDLTRSYFELEDEGIRAAGVARDIPGPTLDLVAAAMKHDKPFLEGLTTLLDVYRETGSLPTALSQARAIKPHLAEPVWREVRSFLKLHPLLAARTQTPTTS